MRKIIYLLVLFTFATSTLAEEITLTEKEALCLGIKWKAARQTGIELFVPKNIEKFVADAYVADFTIYDETVFIINAPINTSTPHQGIKIGFLDSGQSGGKISVYLHFKSANGIKKRIYKLPYVSKLMYSDFEEC
jgi:hypothetical protein